MHKVLLDRLWTVDVLDFSRAAVDHVDQGVEGGRRPAVAGRSRADGTKHHLINHATGIPLAVIMIDASRNYVTQLCPLLDKESAA